MLVPCIVFLVISLLLLPVKSLKQGSHDSLMSTEERQNAMAGGYRECPDLQNPRLLEVAEFVTSQQFPDQYSFSSMPESTLAKVKVKVVRASQQVVAGMNYRILLLLVSGDDSSTSEQPALSSCIGAFTVTVYDRFGTLEVTSWGEEVECVKAKAMLESKSEFFERPDEHSTSEAEGGNEP